MYVIDNLDVWRYKYFIKACFKKDIISKNSKYEWQRYFWYLLVKFNLKKYSPWKTKTIVTSKCSLFIITSSCTIVIIKHFKRYNKLNIL
jgi:hypothetical protein